MACFARHLCFLLLSFAAAASNAAVTETSPLYAEILSTTAGAVIDDWPIRADDFQLRWVGQPIEGVSWHLEARSLSWARLGTLAYPHSSVVIQVTGGQGGLLSYAGHQQVLVPEADGKFSAYIPIVLLSSTSNTLRLAIRNGEKTIEGTLQLVFAPPSSDTPSRSYIDNSCLPQRVEAEFSGNAGKTDWLYVGCRLEAVPRDDYRTSRLRFTVIWDGIGDTLTIDGVPTLASAPGTWTVDVAPHPGSVTLSRDGGSVTLRYRIAERYHRGSLALGLGPYLYRFHGGAEQIPNTVLPIPTFYASLLLAEGVRLVAFDLFTVGQNFLSDIGVYVNFAYYRMLDQRVTLNLMLGGHALAFTEGPRAHFLPDLAQGAEVILHGLFMRSDSVSLGAFIYPTAGDYYSNLWARWRHPDFFVELNYIDWKRSTDTTEFFSTSMGISVGFPLLRFL